ncbi:Uncharacterised protein [Mycobacteroides abscessus subsp. abscessus]|nr:Uncharacterised protein [Mycobacteroides abscessus subsp. abscessus]
MSRYARVAKCLRSRKCMCCTRYPDFSTIGVTVSSVSMDGRRAVSMKSA